MRSRLAPCLLTLALAAGIPAAASAVVAPGQSAPNFTKNQLDSPSFGQVTPRTLADYSGKVIVFFLFGYACPYCIADGPSVQSDIAQHYETSHPGQVQVVGVDEWEGTTVDVRGFRSATGATFPLLLNGTSVAGGNFATLYGTYDNYIVVNKQGIVRYHAALGWPHGNRYHLNEIRACVDSLVTSVVGTGPDPVPQTPRLASAPNPARSATSIELSIPAGETAPATVTVHDAQGRRVATIWEGALAPGVNRFPWTLDDGAGRRLTPGVYLVRASFGARTLTHRVAVLP